MRWDRQDANEQKQAKNRSQNRETEMRRCAGPKPSSSRPRVSASPLVLPLLSLLDLLPRQLLLYLPRPRETLVAREARKLALHRR